MSEPSPQNQPSEPPAPSGALMGMRAALVFLLSVLTAVAAGALWLAAHHPWPEAVVTAGGAGGGALALFNQVIERR
ncbi:hypothetical protein ABZ865_29395 [Streptomyces sp. NPDC047085]|uniref:hypothetical protein n=1 Tax=Streptomyces sp. NPDC047085 TaxID=3155140 RepID=UPI0033E45E7E